MHFNEARFHLWLQEKLLLKSRSGLAVVRLKFHRIVAKSEKNKPSLPALSGFLVLVKIKKIKRLPFILTVYIFSS